MSIAKVVIDTNVLVAALNSKLGASYQLLMLLTEKKYLPNISVPLFVEYESVLKRKHLGLNLSDKQIDDVLNFMLKKSSIRKIFYLWRPVLKDPKDDLVLELAVESKSKYIITFNKKDFKEVDKFGIQVVTPKEFLQIRGLLS